MHMGFTKKYKDMEKDSHVNRWYLNNRARSAISADIWRRNLGLYCSIQGITPDAILKQAIDGSLKNNFQDFVIKMLEGGRKGAYIGKFKQVIRSWLMFNDIDYRIKINIPNEGVNETTMDESVPTKEELSKIMRKATTRGRVSISLMAFSGLRPESLGSYEGNDGLTIGDIEDFNIESHSFSTIPAKVNVRNNLSKARFRYFTFLGSEGCEYITDYLDERRSSGELLTKESPLLIPNPENASTRWKFLRTMLVTREIREAIRSAGLLMRPYVLRAYFATALDISESKGLISHPWRQFIMGHKGDIEATYSTNKRLLPGTIEDMRTAYGKCLKFLETEEHGIKEEDYQKMLRTSAIEAFSGAFGITLSEDQKEELLSLDTEEYQKRLGELFKDKRADLLNNGNKHKTIPETELESYLNKGWELVQIYPRGDKAVVRLPS